MTGSLLLRRQHRSSIQDMGPCGWLLYYAFRKISLLEQAQDPEQALPTRRYMQLAATFSDQRAFITILEFACRSLK